MTWGLIVGVHTLSALHETEYQNHTVALQAELLHKHISEHLTCTQGLTVLKLAGSYGE